MSKYNIDLDYTLPMIDITEEELNEIIVEADKIISGNSDNPKELATAYLKKAQCLYKLEQCCFYFASGGLRSLNLQIEHCFGFDISIDGKLIRPQMKELLEKALELSPDMPEALMRLGTIYENLTDEEGHIDKAIDLITRAIQLKPDYSAAFNNRADISKSSDENSIKKAIADYSEAIRIRPFYANYYNNRASDFSALGLHEKAMDDYSNAIKYGSDTFKKTVHIFQVRGEKYMELKEYGKAIDDFSESLRLEPDINNTLLQRGEAYYLSGEKDKAKADFEEYLSRERKLADDEGRAEISKLIGVIPEGI